MKAQIQCGFALALLLVTTHCFAADFGTLNSIATTAFEAGELNGSVLVAEFGKVVYKKGFGLANEEWNIPNAPDTKFRLGSITKQFTAALILQLANEGKLRLDDTIAQRLPYYRKDTGAKITIHQLLTHTAGLPNYTAEARFREDIMRNPTEVETFVNTHCSGDLEFEPGAEMRYSNSGYFMLGAIVEAVANSSYAEQLETRILDPLDMNDTGYDDYETILERRAAGYEKRGKRHINAPYLDMSLPYSAGSLYSTVEDLFRWDQALYTEQVLPIAMKNLMYTPALSNYAYGWAVREFTPDGTDLKRTEISHGGGINGFSTHILRVPEDWHLVVVLNNVMQSAPGKTAHELLEALY